MAAMSMLVIVVDLVVGGRWPASTNSDLAYQRPATGYWLENYRFRFSVSISSSSETVIVFEFA